MEQDFLAYAQQLAAFTADARARGIPHVTPPMFRALRAFGLRPRPVHYWSFAAFAGSAACGFTLLLLPMCIAFAPAPVAGASLAVAMGAVFGAVFAAVMRRFMRSLRLPPWESYMK